MDNGLTKYTAGSGMIELRDNYQKVMKKIDIFLNRFLCPTVKTKPLFGLSGVIQDGDEVIIFSPYGFFSDL